MQKIDYTTSGGLILGFTTIIIAISLSGTIMGYLSLSSTLITVVGSFSALLISFNAKQIKAAAKIVKTAFYTRESNIIGLIKTFTALSGKARREGLLTLEDEKESLNDPFFERALQMVVDGMEPEVIKDIMEKEIYYLEERHKEGQSIYQTWGMYAPAFGMLGTLIGLVQMLRDLDDPTKIGPAMAIALLTTMYGVVLANLILLPIANKLKVNSQEEVLEKEIILEGVLSIQSGINPRIIEDKLKVFIPPKFRDLAEELEEGEERGAALDAS